MYNKIKITLANILLLGVFAIFAMSSSSSHVEDFNKGWKIGEKIATEVYGDNTTPSESTDSITFNFKNDMASAK
ncbi:MAG: hypothetical protein J5996_03890 [Prevotella sp.]|nr:hypothetical protein [Prevotella sp.]